MRTGLEAFWSLLLVAFMATPASAQFDPCDDCQYNVEEGWAYCILAGGGPFIGCHQQYTGFCSFDGICTPEEEDAVPELALAGGIGVSRSVVGRTTFVETRGCDQSAILRSYAAEDAAVRRESLRRIEA